MIQFDPSTINPLSGFLFGGESVNNAVINNAVAYCNAADPTAACGTAPSGAHYNVAGWEMSASMQSWDFEHNTTLASWPQTTQDLGGYWIGNNPTLQPPQTHNVWKLCNVELRQDQLQGVGYVGVNTTSVGTAMGDPAANLNSRYTGNLYYQYGTDPAATNLPPGNVVSAATFTFVNPSGSPPNYQITNSFGATCPDGHPVGVNGIVGEQAAP